MSDDPSAPPGFQWDKNKNLRNIREHKIAFHDAIRIFEKITLDEIDDRENYSEERTNSLGDLDGRVILNVTHTERNGDIRLISARAGTPTERELYREFVRDLGPLPNMPDIIEPGLPLAKTVGEKLLEAGGEHAQTKLPNPTPKPKIDPTPSISPDHSKGMELKRKKSNDDQSA